MIGTISPVAHMPKGATIESDASGEYYKLGNLMIFTGEVDAGNISTFEYGNLYSVAKINSVTIKGVSSSNPSLYGTLNFTTQFKKTPTILVSLKSDDDVKAKIVVTAIGEI